MKIAGYEIDEIELNEFVKEELATHQYIFNMVKDYIEDILERSFNINANELKAIDPATYFAVILELTRTIYINLVNYLKYKSYKKRYEGREQWRYTQR